MDKYDDDDYPCDDWEARYCCDLCRWLGGGEEQDCDNCSPMDI